MNEKTPHPVDLHVGKMIRRTREIQGRTQSEIAELCGIRFQQMQKYETAANRVSASRLVEIATALNVPVLALLPETDTPTEQVETIAPAELRAARQLATLPANIRATVVKMIGELAKQNEATT